MKFLVIDDSSEIVDAVTLCLSMRWPEAQVLRAGEGDLNIVRSCLDHHRRHQAIHSHKHLEIGPLQHPARPRTFRLSLLGQR